MLLKSLLFALLMSGAAADADDEAPTLIPPPLPRLRGTAQMNSSDVSEGASPDDVIERAAVSNQFNPGPEGRERFSFPTASRAMNQNPDPDSIDARVPSPQAGLVKMPQAVHAIWPILLLWTPHGARMLQVGRLEIAFTTGRPHRQHAPRQQPKKGAI